MEALDITVDEYNQRERDQNIIITGLNEKDTDTEGLNRKLNEALLWYKCHR